MKFSIIKHQPSYFFDNMHEDLTRFLKDTFGDIEWVDKANMPLERTFRPAIEVKETDREYKVKVELTGVKKEDIDVELYENGLVLRAESKFEKEENNEKIYTSEFRYGKFVRSIPLDSAIDPDKAKSEFKHGVLCITLEKKEPEKKEEVKKLKIE